MTGEIVAGGGGRYDAAWSRAAHPPGQPGHALPVMGQAKERLGLFASKLKKRARQCLKCAASTFRDANPSPPAPQPPVHVSPRLTPAFAKALLRRPARPVSDHESMPCVRAPTESCTPQSGEGEGAGSWTVTRSGTKRKLPLALGEEHGRSLHRKASYLETKASDGFPRGQRIEAAPRASWIAAAAATAAAVTNHRLHRRHRAPRIPPPHGLSLRQLAP